MGADAHFRLFPGRIASGHACQSPAAPAGPAETSARSSRWRPGTAAVWMALSLSRNKRVAPSGGAPPALVNEVALRVTGMSRSGNHAIIAWILAQSNGRSLFLNCCEAGESPFSSARPLGPCGSPFRVNYEPFNILSERAGKFSQKELLIYSYEDTFFKPLVRQDAHRDQVIGPQKP